jgi:hypothetical protein
MNTADFNELSELEKRHFYKYSRCGEMVDRRQLDDVLFHEDHVQRPDIQFGGVTEFQNAACNAGPLVSGQGGVFIEKWIGYSEAYDKVIFAFTREL